MTSATNSPSRTETRIYRFGPFSLGADRRSLTRDGQPVDLTPQSIDVLLVLLASAGRIVTKDDLANEVWPARRPRCAGARPRELSPRPRDFRPSQDDRGEIGREGCYNSALMSYTSSVS